MEKICHARGLARINVGMIHSADSASPSPPQPDADLVRAAQRGEKRAFVEIVARHQAMVYGVALGVLGDFTANEDAAQEAFVTAWRKIHELREPEKLRAWLAQIARHAALGHLRRTRGREAIEWDETRADEDQPTPDQLTVSEEEAALVREALNKLPEKFRLPLVLFYCQDQSAREVAEALNLSEDAVRQRLARGREMLRERMSGLVETALRSTQPGAIFTMTIAAAIGALAAPAVLAGGAFAAAATLSTTAATTAASAAASTTPAAVTAMTTSKLSLTTAALVAAACLPLGYAVHFGTEPSATEAAAAVTAPDTATPAPAAPDFGDSELFAEWVRLHEEHGHDAEAMPGLFQAISDIKDTFRRRAFRAALVAEWSQVDPAGGLDFFLGQGGNPAAVRQLFREWLAREPQAAVAKLMSHGVEGDTLTREADILTEIARRAPEAVAAIAARLPENTSHWTHPVADAFAILAEKNLASARAAAEALTGPRRHEALTGVAKAWAKSDFDGAAAWVKTLPDDVDRDGLLRGALMGLASTDPVAALNKADLVPPGGRAGYFADTTVARLLKETGAQDFDGITAWLRDHPGKIAGEDMTGLAQVVTDKLNADPVAFLDQQLARGTLALLNRALGSALLNDAKPQLAKVWDWLKSQPGDEGTRSLRGAVINSAGWQNPDLALAIANELPTTEEGDRQRAGIAQSLLNGGQRLNRFDDLLAQTSGRLRTQLLTSAFQYMNPDALTDPTRWLARLDEVPAETRPEAASNFAGAWAAKNPEQAAVWAAQLPAEGGRVEAVRNVARTWMQSDSLAASEWIAQLPVGAERDVGASMLVNEIAADSPEEAWHWAVRIGDPTLRMNSIQQSLAPLARSHPAEALRWIDSSALAENEKQSLRQAVQAGTITGERETIR